MILNQITHLNEHATSRKSFTSTPFVESMDYLLFIIQFGAYIRYSRPQQITVHVTHTNTLTNSGKSLSFRCVLHSSILALKTVRGCGEARANLQNILISAQLKSIITGLSRRKTLPQIKLEVAKQSKTNLVRRTPPSTSNVRDFSRRTNVFSHANGTFWRCILVGRWNAKFFFCLCF